MMFLLRTTRNFPFKVKINLILTSKQYPKYLLKIDLKNKKKLVQDWIEKCKKKPWNICSFQYLDRNLSIYQLDMQKYLKIDAFMS